MGPCRLVNNSGQSIGDFIRRFSYKERVESTVKESNPG